MGGLAVSRTFAPSIHIVRTKRHIRRDPVDHWVISYCARGAHLAKTADTELEVPARVPYLWSLGQEFLHERTHMERLQLLMRRDAFRDIAPLLDASCGLALGTPLGHLLGDYMMALHRHLPAVTEADLPRLSSTVGAMVVAVVAPSAERAAIARRQIDVGRKERVRQAVRRHLRTPTLAPKNLSRLVGMSRSNLYRLFEDAGGVARYIQRERLLEARAVLSDPATTSRSRQLLRTSASQMLRVSAGLSNESSAITPAMCGRLHWPGWRPPRRHEAAYYRIERTSASSSAESRCTKPPGGVIRGICASRCFCCFYSELSATTSDSRQKILAHRRFGEPKNSQAPAALLLFSAVVVEESSIAKVALPPGTSFSAENDDIPHVHNDIIRLRFLSI
jgi:AraC-like DNA-binding protein